MTIWIAVVPSERAHHRNEPGPGYAVVDESGRLVAFGRLALTADGPRHLQLDIDAFASKVGMMCAHHARVTLVLERHGRSPRECKHPFAAGRVVGAIEGYARGSVLPLMRIGAEEWRDAMLSDPRATELGPRVVAAARERWSTLLAHEPLTVASAEAVLLAEYARTCAVAPTER